jgi:hypothetical protein
MKRFFLRLATPPNTQRGFQLAVLSAVMTSAPHVANLVLLLAGRGAEEYDYALSERVLDVGWVIGQLGVVPLLFAMIALVGRPVRPAGLLPVALVLALCPLVVSALGAVGPLAGEEMEMGMSLVEAVLMTAVTGSALGVVAAGLVLVARPARFAVTLLTTVGVALAATAAFMVLNGVGMSLLVAILLRLAILRNRHDEARRAGLAQESAV